MRNCSIFYLFPNYARTVFRACDYFISIVTNIWWKYFICVTLQYIQILSWFSFPYSGYPIKTGGKNEITLGTKLDFRHLSLMSAKFILKGSNIRIVHTNGWISRSCGKLISHRIKVQIKNLSLMIFKCFDRLIHSDIPNDTFSKLHTYTYLSVPAVAQAYPVN